MTNNLVMGQVLRKWNQHESNMLFSKLECYFWDDLDLFHLDLDQILRRCILKEESIIF